MGIADIMETTQYLTFKLDGEVFAVDIAKVREVLDFTTITKVPRTPDFMRGVINLRGSVVPVVDLRLKFGMPKTERTVNTCIIITEVSVDGETIILGALADSVQEVIDLDPDHIEPAPKIGTKLRTEFIKGMGKQNDKFIILLDINRVFSTDELALVQSAENESSPAARNADAG
jgi:purine-binding chemotaxis protein CheW